MENLIQKQSIIITLDIDPFLFEKLNHIQHTEFSVIELNTVDHELIKKVQQGFPKLHIGVGNIISVEQLETCHKAGAAFITSPGFVSSIAQTAHIYSIHYIPGVATLSEAMNAILAGCHYVRPYPANLPFCTLLNKCLPQLHLFPAEIEWDEVEHFLNLPAVAAVSLINPEVNQLTKLEIA